MKTTNNMKNITKSAALKKIKELEEYINQIDKPLELEDHNFHINSDGWKKFTECEQEYLVNPEGDVWELINCENQELNGEQLFTWDAAMREAGKVGKRVPTDEELTEILKTKEDMPNALLAGYRNVSGGFYSSGSGAYVWSSSQSSSTNAWRRGLHSGYSPIYRNAGNKSNGFALRCLKDS